MTKTAGLLAAQSQRKQSSCAVPWAQRERRRLAGFTLVELMITLAIATILLTVGVPSFRSVIQNNRAATQTNELLSALALARSEAVKRGSTVSVCPSETEAADQEDSDSAICSDDTDWAIGWIVFVDTNGDGAREEPSEEEDNEPMLHLWPNPIGVEVFGGPKFVTYRGAGDVDVESDSPFTHEISGCTGDQARTININVIGQPTVTKDPCSE